MKPLIVASTRPELIKLSPVMREFDRRGVKYVFVTTGQHYDKLLFKTFIDDLELREPDYDIKVGSGSQAYQTSLAMVELEKIMEGEKPDVTIAEGDTNSVLSTSLAAVKLHMPFAHVEAGLRSYDRNMPEEINRILADHCSEALFAPTEKAALNLINEAIPPKKIHIVGNTVVDATLQNLAIARRKSRILEKFPKEYLVLTLHRAENVDSYKTLKGIVDALTKIKENIIFPVHPRTEKMLQKFKLLDRLKKKFLIQPLGYLDFILLLSRAKAVLTDSGGIQEEAVILKVPCITLRNTTERPETVEAGGNVLAGVEGSRILEKVDLVLNDRKLYKKMRRAKNPFGDGKTGKRIVKILLEKHEKGELEISSPDFTQGFWKREFIAVDSKLHGKKIRNLNFDVLKIIENEREKYPYEDAKLKRGQVIEILRR
ncbi:MAG: UDP-N-acetylglucosamine 2-epimerase (non-hydrolyzing) [Euryarchaeota archaeon]|nr:UDP-N-acetylglucosamine 2-epimerase (non-hydrolyzing) [Euryarchaeota archaeon]